MRSPLTPSPGAVRALDRTLRLTVALACLGAARWALQLETPLVSWLWGPAETGGWGWPEQTAVGVDRIAGWLMLVAAGLTLVAPCWPVLLGVALWHVLVPVSISVMGGEFLAETSVPAHAARIAAPLALLILRPWPGRVAESAVRLESTLWLLRLAAACTFAVHGYQALMMQPVFIDYLIAAADRLLSADLSEQHARQALWAIGAIDIALAAGLVLFRWWRLAMYMAFWGLVTALCRVLYQGWPGSHETLVRAAHAGVPLAIGLYWRLSPRIPPQDLSAHVQTAKPPPGHVS